MTDSKIFIRDRLIIDPEAGSLTVVYWAVPLLSGATAAVSYRSGGRKRYLSILGRDMAYGVGLRQQEEVSLSRANGELQLDWHIALDDEVEMWLEVTNVGQTPLQVDEFHVLAIDAAQGGKVELGSPPRRWSFYQNGWQSWSPAFARHMDGGLYVDPNTEDYQTKHQPHYRPGQGDAFSSEWFTVLRGRGTGAKGRFLLLGFITTKEQLAEVRLSLDSEGCETLVAICHADGVTLESGERLFSERLVIVPGEDPFGLLKDYAQRLGRRLHTRLPCGAHDFMCRRLYPLIQGQADTVITR